MILLSGSYIEQLLEGRGQFYTSPAEEVQKSKSSFGKEVKRMGVVWQHRDRDDTNGSSGLQREQQLVIVSGLVVDYLHADQPLCAVLNCSCIE